MPSSPAAATPAPAARTSAVIADALAVDRGGPSPGDAAVELFSSDYDRAVAAASTSPARDAGPAGGREGVAGLASSAPGGRPRARPARRRPRGGRGGAARTPPARRAIASVVSASGAPRRGRRSSKRPRPAPRSGAACDEPAVSGAGTNDARTGESVEEPTRGARGRGANGGVVADAADGVARSRVDGGSGGDASNGSGGPRRSGGSASKEAMLGLAPKSAFLRWLRSLAQGKGAVAASVATKALQSRRRSAYWHFRETRASGQKRSADDALDPAPVRVTRSAAPEFDDWTVDTDAAECRVTDTRRLDRYVLEHLFTVPRKTNLLLLVSVSADAGLFGGRAARADAAQQLPRRFIDGVEYYQLRCWLSDTTDNDLVTGGVASKMYSLASFKSDFDNGKKGFQITFSNSPDVAHFTWKFVIERPKEFMFFGPPLSSTRSFDSIFKGTAKLDTAHHLFVCYHDHVLGDANACLALQNAYLSRRCAILEKQLKDAQSSSALAHVSSAAFRNSRTKDFLTKIDRICEQALLSACTEFQRFSRPVVEHSIMLGLVEEARDVFGSLWGLMLELRGEVNTREGSRHHEIVARSADDRRNSVFFQLLSMARCANRHRLLHWAMITSVANFARGVGRSAESAFAYFGPSITDRTRRRLFAKLTGDDKAGIASNNTWRYKIMRLFRGCRALILCYDNYQRGVTLQHQRGKHSSAYFKGTHQCGHKVNEYNNNNLRRIQGKLYSARSRHSFAPTEQDDEAQERPLELTEASNETISKKKVHELMGEDPWPLGREKLEGRNIIETRADLARRLVEKSKIRECILADIVSMEENTPVSELVHTNDLPPWQRALRSRKNNLGLTM